MTQMKEGRLAVTSCEELLDFANNSLSISDEDQFLQAAKQIKEKVTMAPAFRLTTRAATTENMSQFSVDFSEEREGLQRLHFLPVPPAPHIDASRCVVRDNSIFVEWSAINQSEVRYDLHYRKSDRDYATRNAESCWHQIQDLRETRATVSGLKFDSRFVVLQVRARNKAAAGEFSEAVALETPAFNFSFDAATAHPELKVQDQTVTWEPQVKGHDPRLKAKENKSSSRSNIGLTAAEVPLRRQIKQRQDERRENALLENPTQFWVTRRSLGVVITGSCNQLETGNPCQWAWPIVGV